MQLGNSTLFLRLENCVGVQLHKLGHQKRCAGGENVGKINKKIVNSGHWLGLGGAV